MTTLVAWIFFVAVIELVPFSGGPSVPNGDKIIHIALYAITGFLVFTLLIKKMSFRAALILTVLLSTIYGAALEILQGFTGRTPDLMDALANAFGTSIAAFVIGYKRRWK